MSISSATGQPPLSQTAAPIAQQTAIDLQRQPRQMAIGLHQTPAPPPTAAALAAILPLQSIFDFPPATLIVNRGGPIANVSRQVFERKD